MANWFADAKDGSDLNGGTSWVDAVETLAQLCTLGGADDYYYILGHGSDYQYPVSAHLPAENRHWRGVKNGGALWRPPWIGWPMFMATGTRAYDGPLNPYSVKDIYFENFEQGVDNLRDNAAESVVERCVCYDCDDGIWLGNEDDLIARYNLVINCRFGIYDRCAGTITGQQMHHNTVIGCTEAGITTQESVGNSLSIDAFHSNIIVDCDTGILLDPDGTLIFTVAGEPDYNVYDNNNTDLDDGGHGVSKGSNAITADPLFVNKALHDYRLKRGSPALYSDASSKNRGGLGPGMTSGVRLRNGKFFSAPGHLIEAETLWRDEHLVGT